MHQHDTHCATLRTCRELRVTARREGPNRTESLHDIIAILDTDIVYTKSEVLVNHDDTHNLPGQNPPYGWDIQLVPTEKAVWTWLDGHASV